MHFSERQQDRLKTSFKMLKSLPSKVARFWIKKLNSILIKLFSWVLPSGGSACQKFEDLKSGLNKILPVEYYYSIWSSMVKWSNMQLFLKIKIWIQSLARLLTMLCEMNGYSKSDGYYALLNWSCLESACIIWCLKRTGWVVVETVWSIAFNNQQNKVKHVNILPAFSFTKQSKAKLTIYWVRICLPSLDYKTNKKIT